MIFNFFHCYHEESDWHEIGIGNWFRAGVMQEGGFVIILIRVWGRRILHISKSWKIDA